MDEQIPMDEQNKAAAKGSRRTRRAFVKTAAQIAVTAPAVSILLAGSTKMAAAQIPYDACSASARCGPPPLDDFTFGNNEEDLDAINLGSNFNPFNGTNNQDDVLIP